nr:hypothetical protein [uncultured Roseateles sp.]
MYARLTAFAVWALLAGSLVFWALRLGVSPLPAPSRALAAAEGAPARVDLSRLLGSSPAGTAVNAEPAEESRFRLLGVVAPKRDTGSGEGVALIAVDGKPAKPVRIGASVDGDVLLLSLTANSAGLGAKGTAEAGRMVLRLPPATTAVNAPIGSPGTALPGSAAAPANEARPGAPVLGGAVSGGPMVGQAPPGNMPFRVGGVAAIPAIQPTPGMNPVPNADAQAMPQLPMRQGGEPTR